GEVNVDSKDEHGRTPLLLAAREGHQAVVELLLKTGKVDVEPKDIAGQTPLWYAAQRGDQTVVELL
ncbi:ankyrin, partial [Melanomma pulvis-pyrius CBS 109.77]